MKGGGLWSKALINLYPHKWSASEGWYQIYHLDHTWFASGLATGWDSSGKAGFGPEASGC